MAAIVSSSYNPTKKPGTPPFSFLLLPFYIFLLIAPSVAQETLAPSLQVSSPPSTPIHAGDRFEWTIMVEWEDAPNANAEIESLPQWENLHVLERSTRVVMIEREGRRIVQKNFRFLIEALDAGEASIGRAVILWESGNAAPRTQRLRSDPVWFNVVEAPPATRFANFWFWATLLLFVAASVTLITWNRIRKREFELGLDTLDPVQARIETAFQEAERRRLEGDFGGFTRALSQAVHAGLTKAEDPEDTPLDSMRERVNEPLRPIFDRLMDEFRELPYSPEKPSNDRLDQLIADARRLTDGG